MLSVDEASLREDEIVLSFVTDIITTLVARAMVETLRATATLTALFALALAESSLKLMPLILCETLKTTAVMILVEGELVGDPDGWPVGLVGWLDG